MDPWITPTYESAVAHVKGVSVNHKREQAKGQEVETTLTGKELELFKKGKEIYARDGFCVTCHQPDGKGLEASGFPPSAGSPWDNGNEKSILKIIPKRPTGPLEV